MCCALCFEIKSFKFDLKTIAYVYNTSSCCSRRSNMCSYLYVIIWFIFNSPTLCTSLSMSWCIPRTEKSCRDSSCGTQPYPRSRGHRLRPSRYTRPCTRITAVCCSGVSPSVSGVCWITLPVFW